MATEKFYIKRNDLQPYCKIVIAGDGDTSLYSQAVYDDATLTVNSTSDFATSGSLRISDYVTVTYSGKSPTTFTNCLWSGGSLSQTFPIGTSVQEVMNLSGTTVVFSMKIVGGSTLKINRQTANITNANGGEVEYRWSSTDTNTSGQYLAEFEITPNSGGKYTIPKEPSNKLVIIVTDDVDAI